MKLKRVKKATRNSKATLGRATKVPKKAVASAKSPSHRQKSLTKASLQIDGAAASSEVRRKEFPIVGIGASAGGLEACTELLKNLPTDTGMAFVLVQHLDPEHESLLPALLANSTTMPVLQVRNGMGVEPNQFYVIPPNATMAINDRVLKLLPRQPRQGPQRCIDMFFESLAEDRGHEAIGVILSGTASDGTLGLGAIKGEGGLTFAQDDSARFNSMPRSAMAAGSVDFVMPPGEIARELSRIARHPFVARPDGAREPEPPPELADGFKQILKMVRRMTGVDSNYYKPGMLHRRIKRRMVLNRTEDLRAYATFLNSHPEEIEALAQDFLIGVTSFFRDPPSFEFLQKKIFPRILKAHEQEGLDNPVRVWVPGCSTGQEVYSIAIAWLEFTKRSRANVPMQIFGTDVNEAYLEKARAAVYAKSLVLDVSKERLRRFFVEVETGYRVNKPVREMCVFARQNVTSDPPFSRMQLISCRNLLIYLQPEVQKRILSVLHFSLKPHAFLFMGRADSVSNVSDLYTPIDRRYKIFIKEFSQSAVEMHFNPRVFPVQRAAGPILQSRLPAVSGGLEAQRQADKLLLSRYAPASVVVNSEFEIMQFRGRTGPFLETPPGRATLNLLKMAEGELREALHAALMKARRSSQSAEKKGIKVTENGRTLTVDLEVISLKGTSGDGRFFLVLFQPVDELSQAQRPSAAKKSAQSGAKGPPADQSELTRLQRELADTNAHLQAVISEHETYAEELQSVNEEAQAGNEELQSVNEELETSKEELQATNEELGTINAELHARNAELGHANEDLANLLGSVRLPIVMVGIDLRIRRFNVAAGVALHLIPTDVGRPIGHLRSPVESVDLEALLAEVIQDMAVREYEVQDRQGRWFILRAHPYRTAENKIEGAILLLIDIDELKRTTESRDYSQAIINTLHEPLVVLRPDLRVNTANRAFYELLDTVPRETEGQLIYELGGGVWDFPQLRELLEQTVPRNHSFTDFELTRDFGRSGRRTLLLNARTLDTGKGRPPQILLAMEDVTERRKSEEALRASELRYRRIFESAKDGILVLNPETQRIIDAYPYMVELLGYNRQEFIGGKLWEVGLLKDEAANRAAFTQLRQHGVIRYDDLPLQTKSGEPRDVELVCNVYDEANQQTVQCNVRDVTERQQLLKSLRDAEAFRRLMVERVQNHAIFTVDVSGRINTWNVAAERVFGYTEEEILGQSGDLLFPPEDRSSGIPQKEIEAATETGSASDERWHVRKDGRRIRLSGEMTPIWDETGHLRGFTKVARDITEQYQAQEALRLAQAQLAERADRLERAVEERTAELAERNKQLEAFVYSIAHDLRAPLRSMQGFSGLLLTDATSGLSPTAQNYAERINRSSQFMDQSLVGLLNFSHIMMQQIDLTPINLEAALQSTLTQLEAQIQERQARIEAAGPWPTVLGHEMTLGQVLLNLIGNAIKFVPPNVTPVVRIRTEERKTLASASAKTHAGDGPIIRLWVEDNGVGISEEHQAKLFRLFSRLCGRDFAGTGIGLAIVKEGVRRMGGAVGVESEVNRGSRFWFELRRPS